MKYIKLSVFIITLLTFSFYSNSQTIKNSIRWGTKEISWDDYKGKPNSPSAAVTMSVIHLGIDYPSNKEAIVTFEALFNPRTSWTRTKTNALLIHEKGHFDIAELYTRKLRKEIRSKSFKVPTFEDELFALHKRFCTAMDAYQDRYDSETDFSRNSEKQQLWSISIENQLEELKEHVAYLNKIPIN